VAYLETSDRELTGKLQTMQTLSESQRGRLQELSGRLAALEADGGEVPAQQQIGVTTAEPSDEELWELSRKCLEKALPSVKWARWSDRLEDTPWTSVQIAINRALFDAGVAHATARAEQQATVKESLTVEPDPADPSTPGSLHDVALAHVDSLGRSFGILPAILDTIRRAIREPMAAPAGRVATDEELRDAWELAPAPGGIFNSNYCLRAVYNLGRQHGAACPYIRSSDEGTSYCALAEQPAPAAPAPEPAPPAPAGGLVEEIVWKVPGSKEEEIRWVLGVVAEWLKGHQPSHETEPDSIDFAAYLLSMEATR
jgi:hypothetical protein